MSSDEDLSFNPYKAIAEFTLKEETTNATNFGYEHAINKALDSNLSLTNIDDLLSISGLGPVDSAVTANFWGIRRAGHALAAVPAWFRCLERWPVRCA